MSTLVRVVSSTWTQLGVGTLVLQNTGGKTVLYQRAAAQPPDSDLGKASLKLLPDKEPLDVAINGSWWGRCQNVHAPDNFCDVIVEIYP